MPLVYDFAVISLCTRARWRNGGTERLSISRLLIEVYQGELEQTIKNQSPVPGASPFLTTTRSSHVNSPMYSNANGQYVRIRSCFQFFLGIM